MKYFKSLVLFLGLATLVLLIWKLDPPVIWALVRQVGWGMLLIVPLHGIDHIFNSLGWRYAFNTRGDTIPLWELFRVRIAGDGVNYLTPSATIAGEVIRPAMLGPAVETKEAISSVVVAKFTQALAQAVFVLLGLALVIKSRITLVRGADRIFWVGGGLLIAVLFGFGTYAWATRRRERPQSSADNEPGAWSFAAIRTHIGGYFREHPGRFLLSIFFFTLGYLWGAVEVYMVCIFLGMPVTALIAVTIESLSSMLDGMAFMVPAKIGTQEAGKTAVFAALGLPASKGLAFGIIRHIRELIWAGAGFSVYVLQKRSRHPLPSPEKHRPPHDAGAVAPL